MKNKGLMWMVLGIMAFIVILFYLIATFGGGKKAVNWTEHYTGSSKDPYGEYLLQELLKDKYTNTTIVSRSLSRTLPASKDSLNNNYLFIGHTLYMNEKDRTSFLAFVENGNKAFIAAKVLPGFLVQILHNITVSTAIAADSLPVPEGAADADTVVSTEYETTYTEENSGSSVSEEEVVTEEYIEEEEEEETYVTDTVSYDTYSAEPSENYIDTVTVTDEYYVPEKSKQIRLTFKQPVPQAGTGYVFKEPLVKIWEDTVEYAWNSIHPSIYTQANTQTLAVYTDDQKDSLVTMIGIPYGKGMIYIHSNPILFTNFYLKTKEGLDQTEHALSVLSNEKIYWDEFNKVYSDSENGEEEHKDYLKYILSKESLKWAWHSLLGFALLFVLFRSKRRQRIIPVIEPILNSSLDFVSTTGRLYFHLGSHHKVVRLNMKLFTSMLYQKYGVMLKNGDEPSLDYLAVKSGIPKETYTKVFTEYNRLTDISTTISNKDLHTFYIQLQEIYQKITL